MTCKIKTTLLQKLKKLDKVALEIYYKKAYLDGMQVEHDDPMHVHLKKQLDTIEVGIVAIERELEILNGRR